MDNQNSIERIDSAISDSRQATYDKTLYSYYDEFRKGSVNFDTVYNKGQYYMAKQYGKRKEISSSVFMLLREPKVYKMTSYNTPAGGSYNQLKHSGKRLRRCSGIRKGSGHIHRHLPGRWQALSGEKSCRFCYIPSMGGACTQTESELLL